MKNYCLTSRSWIGQEGDYPALDELDRQAALEAAEAAQAAAFEKALALNWSNASNYSAGDFTPAPSVGRHVGHGTGGRDGRSQR